jgi:hypothetical protein
LTEVVTVLAALIGAVVGSLGAVLLQERHRRSAKETERRRELVRRHLYQLQDATESLWFRLDNLRRRGGRWVMSEDYMAETTLYALGRVLASERILGLEGVYPEVSELDRELGSFLKDHRIDPVLAGEAFYQYHRLMLAETLIEREGDRFRVSTYVDFRMRYDSDERVRELLAPARKGLETLDGPLGDKLKTVLEDLARRLARETGLATSIAPEA